MPQDVIAALKDAEFETFLPRLDAELKKYNDIQCDKRNTYRRKVKEDKVTIAPDGGEGEEVPAETAKAPANGTDAANGHADDDDAERPAKKLRGDDGSALAPGQDDMEEDEGELEQE
ncbi:hypothetical protein LTR53_019204, partial [Teratosphaeriaceae sp. CCFEE 6253]